MLPVRQIHFQDLSDISSEDAYSEQSGINDVPLSKRIEDEQSSESDVGGGSRFLKKHPNTGDRQSSAPTGSYRPPMEEFARTPQPRSQSAALTRLAQLEERFRHRSQASQAAQPMSPPSPHETPLSVHSSNDLTMKGTRFLKKKDISLVPEKSKQDLTKQIASKAPLNTIASKGIDLDSDEEDMKILLEGALSSPDVSPRPAEKVSGC